MITKIKDKLYGNKDLIVDILEELELENITFPNSSEIRWGGKGGNRIDINTLGYISFSHNSKGDILTLVSEIKNITLGEAIKWLAKKLNLSYEYKERIQVKPPFGGFWKQYVKTMEDDETPAKIYDMSRLEEYDIGVSKLFIDDGISAVTQEQFNIGYDILSNRITIPWFSCESELVGIVGRLNKRELNDKDSKYLPIIAFAKRKVLYGLNVNYKNILSKNCIIITESEKSVLKAHQYGMDNVVALGGNQISTIQERLIKSLHCNVIMALDEGIEMEHCIEQVKKLKIDNPFFSNSIFVLDMNGLEEKSCIFDLDYEIIKKAFEERLIYIG